MTKNIGQGMGAEGIPLRAGFQRYLHHIMKFNQESYQLCSIYEHQKIVNRLGAFTFLNWNSNVISLNAAIVL